MAEPVKEAAYLKIVITPDVYSKLDKFKRDLKGADVSDVVVSVAVGNGHAHEQHFSMSEFLEALGLEDADKEIKPCDECGGIGEHVEVSTDEYENGNIMRGVGSAMCSQAIEEADYEPSEDR